MTLPTYTPDALRGLLKRHAITGGRAGRMLGVEGRSIRKWTASRESVNAHAMPRSAWWLLLLLTREITLKEIETALSEESAENNG